MVVPELLDQRVAFERGLHDSPLNTAAAPVDQPHLPEPGALRRSQIFIHY